MRMLPLELVASEFEPSFTLSPLCFVPYLLTFASGWLAAPSGLPATSLNNFSIFCNGALIENEAIVSFTVNGANNLTTLVIDPNELGYSFDLQDEVVAIGKFNS
jgi:hypothetical protein